MPTSDINAAEQTMVAEFAPNQWFLTRHWPENRSRVREILSTLLTSYPDRNARVLDVGCFNGYISLLAKLMGFDVTGSDAFGFPDRDLIFSKYGIQFLHSNLNDAVAFAGCPRLPFTP
ncbi:MAG: class I SAM-dependent methyltransferase [Terriglobales bacterium]